MEKETRPTKIRHSLFLFVRATANGHSFPWVSRADCRQKPTWTRRHQYRCLLARGPGRQGRWSDRKDINAGIITRLGTVSYAGINTVASGKPEGPSPDVMARWKGTQRRESRISGRRHHHQKQGRSSSRSLGELITHKDALAPAVVHMPVWAMMSRPTWSKRACTGHYVV